MGISFRLITTLRRHRLTALIDILHHITKPHPRPVLAVEQRQAGPMGFTCGDDATTTGALAADDGAVAHAAGVGVIVVVVAVVIIIMLATTATVGRVVVMTPACLMNRTIRRYGR